MKLKFSLHYDKYFLKLHMQILFQFSILEKTYFFANCTVKIILLIKCFLGNIWDFLLIKMHHVYKTLIKTKTNTMFNLVS